MKNKKFSSIVIGSGPAAYTAAIYLCRAEIDCLVLTGFNSGPVGGQLITTTEVENFPGFPDGISGPDLMLLMRKQVEKFGAIFVEEDAVSIEKQAGGFFVRTSNDAYFGKSIVIATGATAKKLEVPGSQEFWQKGISACAVCDGAMPIFRDADLAVIGGGDAAMEEASFLTRFAKKVYIVHRRKVFRASAIMTKRVLANPKIEVVWDSVLEEVMGDDFLNAISIKNVQNGEKKNLSVKGLFFAIGHSPNTKFLGSFIELDTMGYIVVDPGTTKTSLSGVFAAGDVSDPHYRQAITAAGSGCMAALDCERWLSSNNS